METASSQQPIETVGRYEVAGRIAIGGMAEILLGRLSGPSGFERVVVVKRILPHLAETQSFVQMFLDEARIAAHISHPNVVQVHELGKEGDDLFIVMEYLEGESVMTLLRRVVARRQELDPLLIAAIGAGCAAGLHAAHELQDEHGERVGLVHRDVSPQNVFLTYDGVVKVLDFGIAKAATQMSKTATGELKGKFAYMSPEQVEGKSLDRRSDIFSLGIVLYEAATGRRLFRKTSQMETLRAVSAASVEAPSEYRRDIPPDLEAIIMRCLEGDPNKRFQSAKDTQRELLAFFHRTAGPLPEELIAERMRGLFSDRVLEKRLMLQRLRDGSDVTDIPSGELDADIELLPTRVRAEPTLVERRPVNRSSSVMPWHLAIVLVVVVGAVVLAVWLAKPDAQLRTTPLSPRASSQPEPSAPPVMAEPEAPAARVDVIFATSPEGATVSREGEDLGMTPVELSLLRSEQEVEFELRLDGFQPATLRIRPDQPVRTQTTLVPLEETPAPMAPRMRIRMRPSMMVAEDRSEMNTMRFEAF